MGFFKKQLSSVVEWQEQRDDIIFWKWHNDEIKKDSRLVIRPGQDAIFMYNGRIEGVFTDEGTYEISSEILPFLSSLKGFKFGFNSGLRSEVLFVNTKEFTLRWGTKNAINIPNPQLPGGLPVRCFGTFSMKVTDYVALIDKVAGVRDVYRVEELQERVISVLDQYLMRWIVKEGKDLFNLQANSMEIASGIRQDLDMEMIKLGMSITDFHINSFSYPKEIQDRIADVASTSMVGNAEAYQQVKMVDAMTQGGRSNAGTMAADVMGMAAGMKMAEKILNPASGPAASNSGSPKFCTKCGQKLSPGQKFCPECGNPTGA